MPLQMWSRQALKASLRNHNFRIHECRCTPPPSSLSSWAKQKAGQFAAATQRRRSRHGILNFITCRLYRNVSTSFYIRAHHFPSVAASLRQFELVPHHARERVANSFCFESMWKPLATQQLCPGARRCSRVDIFRASEGDRRTD